MKIKISGRIKSPLIKQLLRSIHNIHNFLKQFMCVCVCVFSNIIKSFQIKEK